MRVVSTRVVYENRWMRVHEDRTERDDGTPGLYGWVEKPPSALIVPIEDGHVWLVEQYRHPVGSSASGSSRRARGRTGPARSRGARAAGAGRGDGPARRAHGAPRPAALRLRAVQPGASTSGARPGSNPASRRSKRPSRTSSSRRFTVDEVERMVARDEHPRRRLGRRVAPRYAVIVPTPTTTSPRSRHAVWPGRGAVERLAQLELERRALAVDPAGHGAGVVAQADARRPRRPAGAGPGAAHARRAGVASSSREPTTTVCRSRAQHVQRLRRRRRRGPCAGRR